MTEVCRGGVLLSLLVALFTRNQVTVVGQECTWDSPVDAEQPGLGFGLDPRSLDAGARHLAFLENIKDEVGCQSACCANPECQIAMIGTPADDGTPECFLVGCMKEGKYVCTLQRDTQFKVYLRKANKQEKEEEPPSKEAPKVADRNSTDTDRCRLTKYMGPCRAAFRKYYYDVTNQSCKLFTYGGCGANGNNFNTQEECETTCSGVTGAVLEYNAPPPSGGARRMLPQPADYQTPVPELSKDVESEPESESSPPESEPAAVPAEDPVFSSPKALPEMSSSDFAERCEPGPVVGPCRAALKHWYYHSETHTCKPFIYGGCRGNKNNYVNEQSCMATCTVTVVPSARRVPVDSDQAAKDYHEHCMVASDPGPCRAAFPMFYYKPSTGTCQSFIYGGCKGNKNRYEALEDCTARCSGREGKEGRFEEHGHTKKRWTPAPFYLIATLAVISALLLAALVLITLRRTRLHRQPASSVSDKEELLPDPDEQSSVESLSLEENPKVAKA